MIDVIDLFLSDDAIKMAVNTLKTVKGFTWRHLCSEVPPAIWLLPPLSRGFGRLIRWPSTMPRAERGGRPCGGFLGRRMATDSSWRCAPSLFRHGEGNDEFDVPRDDA